MDMTMGIATTLKTTKNSSKNWVDNYMQICFALFSFCGIY